MFRFNKKYFLSAIILFLTEVFIAAFVDDKIIRPYIGDLLVVILLYCILKSFVNAPVLQAAILVLLFSYLIETLQYFKLIKLLRLQHSTMAKLILGNSFAWIDMLMYTLGILAVIAIEKYRQPAIASST